MDVKSHSEIEQRMKVFVQEVSMNRDGSHDWNHISRVLCTASSLAMCPQTEREAGRSLDLQLIRLAAILHDVLDKKYVTQDENELEKGKKQSHSVLNERMMNQLINIEPKYNRILDLFAIIDRVSFSLQHKNQNTSAYAPERIYLEPEVKHVAWELKVVQDADRLDAIGTIGIARVFMYSGIIAQSIEETLEHFEQKLMKLETQFYTPKARKIARQRHLEMEVFLQQLKTQLNSQDTAE
mmetsp:Transcript_826/g.1557  ORF Transcript_826/g.1557 Transcript_826/m.1557 type:complete len:239 (+) Transcript_826:519-1235(+)